MRPMLVLDVDGPLNPDRNWPREPLPGYATFRWKTATRRGSGSLAYRRLPRVWLNPDHGRQLAALDADLVWGTSWNSLANQYIGPAIGLPVLPTIHVGEPAWTERPGGLHWKAPALAKFRATAPMIWVDDECTPHDALWLSEHRGSPVMVYPVDPRVGLVPSDFEAIAALLKDLG